MALALAGAGLGVGAVFGVLAMNGKSSLDHECPGGACPASAQHDIDSLGRNDTFATIGFGVGAASLVVAAVLWLLERPSSATRIGSNDRATVATPSLQPGLASITGRF